MSLAGRERTSGDGARAGKGKRGRSMTEDPRRDKREDAYLGRFAMAEGLADESQVWSLERGI